MAYEIYRIDRTILGKVGNFFKTPPLPTPIKDHIPATVLPVMGIFRTAKDIITPGVYILSKEDDISLFYNPLGNTLIENTYYIRHPKALKNNCLIPVKDFQRYVLKEQISEIISYLRSNLAIKNLRIKIQSGSKELFDVKTAIGDINAKITTQDSEYNEQEIIIDCSKPLETTDYIQRYIWLDEFSSIKSAVRSFSEGNITMKEKYLFGSSSNSKINSILNANTKGSWINEFNYFMSFEV